MGVATCRVPGALAAARPAAVRPSVRRARINVRSAAKDSSKGEDAKDSSSRKIAEPTTAAIADQTQPETKPKSKGEEKDKIAAESAPVSHEESSGPRVVVVGAGWAGFGAAKHLSEQGYRVTLVDASPNPGGLSAGWRTKEGRAVEAGMKGFWYQYPNIFGLVDELGIEKPFTPFTRSGFWDPKGLVTESPVFSDLPRLPTLLGQFVHTFELFRRLPLQDRLTMFPLFAAVVDYNATPATYERYDKMTARELFRQYGVSQALYDQFLKPLLLVGLFAPPEELSAAVVLDTFYFYSLAHQQDFDVCWCKGSVAERIFKPMMDRMEASGTKILGGHAVVDLHMDESAGRATGVTCRQASGKEVRLDADAVVFAVGVTGMQKLVQSVPALARRSFFRGMCNLKGIDVVAARVWLDKKVDTKFSSNVLSGFIDNVGGTWFNLNELHDEYQDSPGSVIAADFYHANVLLPMSDEEIVGKIMESLVACEPGFKGAKVEDYAVLRFPRAVTHFSPGSYRYRPTQTTPIRNVFMAGDWCKGIPHGANGLSQERAYVTGLRAATLVTGELGVGQAAEVKDVEEDEPHIKIAKDVNSQVKALLESAGILPSPFLF